MTELQLRIHIEGRPESTVRVAQDEFIIGRLPECDLCLPFSEISRQHSRLYCNPSGQWHIEDLGSTNGTVLNQQELKQPHPLTSHDVIQMGNVFLAVRVVSSRPTPPPKPLPTSHNPGQTILRNAEELQKEWIKVEDSNSNDTQTTHHRTISRLKYLVEIAKDLNSAESLDAIFQQVQAVVFRELTNIQRLALLVDVEGTGHLKLMDAAARNELPEESATYSNSWIGRSICEKVFREKVAIKSVDAQQDARFQGEQSILVKGIRGALAVPLWDTNKVVGVLYADANLTLKGTDASNDEDLSFFSTLANLVAYSVQRWLLTQKLQGEAKIRQQLERYHSPSVVQQLMAVGALENGRIKPVEADMSIIFADLVGFSEMSERMTPSGISELLDRFFEEMLQSVFAAGGTLDKFIGDCIMAFFGAPEPQMDHADRAVRAAMGMLDRLDTLNADRVWPEPLQLRIAINSGRAVVGDVGSTQRVDYTVLGGTVNVAARMEGICPPSECVISEATYRRLRHRDGFGSIGEHRFKGIDRPIKVFQSQRRDSSDCHVS
ncbi:MAG: adenylate/guanylate cyclase domain-containing protein [Jaaginema sp. PMC 1080.18]|nr:adenylate/guanylate cyclase domain-containing protein [Jaaginema sp. PMC 1080.18]MEC4869196.1 adenylate/guanylate cyclase domain-containing protein [Jaaginema sp. PMC 1078.18]